MKSARLVAFLILVPLCACDNYVEKSKVDALMKENADLKKRLAQQEDIIKNTPHHHYSLHTQGARAWRFDADTGQTCLQLASAMDWKDSKIKEQSCACEDLIANHLGDATNTTLHDACGW